MIALTIGGRNPPDSSTHDFVAYIPSWYLYLIVAVYGITSIMMVLACIVSNIRIDDVMMFLLFATDIIKKSVIYAICSASPAPLQARHRLPMADMVIGHLMDDG